LNDKQRNVKAKILNNKVMEKQREGKAKGWKSKNTERTLIRKE